MEKVLKKLNQFFKQNSPAIIVNTSTNKALLCLDPQLTINGEGNAIFVHFNSLNDHGGNSVLVKNIEKEEPQTLYFENEQENILMIQALSLPNYEYCIRRQYFNLPKFDSLDQLKSYIQKQI